MDTLILVIFGLIGIVVVLTTCGDLFANAKTINDEAIAFVVALILLKYWPFWLVIYFLKKRELKKKYNEEIRKLP